jgi:enoyl-CoA hydratase/carnithine racemase
MNLPDLEHLTYELRGHVAVVMLNRPEVRNALNARAYADVEAVFRHIQGNGEVRAVVLTGADPAFCSGEDVKQMMTGPQREQSQARLMSVRPRLTPAAEAVLECDRPIIAAVNVLRSAGGWNSPCSPISGSLRSALNSARSSSSAGL